MRRPFNVSSWSHSLPRHRCFFGSCNTSSFRHTNYRRRDCLFKARDPNAFVLSRTVERSHRPIFIVYLTLSCCNFAVKQRFHVQICLSGFRGHGFMERSVVTLATPSVKRKIPRTNSPPHQRIVETRTIEIS